MAIRYEEIEIVPLLILGGQSSRMGTPKHLLTFPDGRPAYQHTLDTLQSAVPTAREIIVSVRSVEQASAITKDLETRAERAQSEHGHDDGHDFMPVKYTTVLDAKDHGDLGPAAGLLAAHSRAPEKTFMVVGCDYPLLPASGLLQLILEYQPPVTCFSSREETTGKEFMEPVIAIWGPDALQRLEQEVLQGLSGLNRVVKLCGGTGVKPLMGEWITGCNTPEEWELALEVLRKNYNGL